MHATPSSRLFGASGRPIHSGRPTGVRRTTPIRIRRSDGGRAVVRTKTGNKKAPALLCRRPRSVLSDYPAFTSIRRVGRCKSAGLGARMVSTPLLNLASTSPSFTSKGNWIERSNAP
jgi:hypothetical protein